MRTSTQSFEVQRRSRFSRLQRAGVWQVGLIDHTSQIQFTIIGPERTYPHAQYKRSSPTSSLVLVPSPESTPSVRWSSISDPNLPGALCAEAHPIEITVRPGESLYLPAGWWHYVRQSEVTVAVNYWYDLESRGSSWVWLNLLRGSTESLSTSRELEDS